MIKSTPRVSPLFRSNASSSSLILHRPIDQSSWSRSPIWLLSPLSSATACYLPLARSEIYSGSSSIGPLPKISRFVFLDLFQILVLLLIIRFECEFLSISSFGAGICTDLSRAWGFLHSASLSPYSGNDLLFCSNHRFVFVILNCLMTLDLFFGWLWIEFWIFSKSVFESIHLFRGWIDLCYLIRLGEKLRLGSERVDIYWLFY